jgi:hypothetical protein
VTTAVAAAASDLDDFDDLVARRLQRHRHFAHDDAEVCPIGLRAGLSWKAWRAATPEQREAAIAESLTRQAEEEREEARESRESRRSWPSPLARFYVECLGGCGLVPYFGRANRPVRVTCRACASSQAASA